MQTKSILCFLVMLAAGCGPAFARLGESPRTVGQRYGPPVSTGTLAAFTRCVYEKQSFTITVFFQNGVSVMETFASRGLDQATARQVVTRVAARSIGCPDQRQELQLRQAAGITCKDEIFWTWTKPVPVNAAFNPIECTLAFFGPPAVYATIHQALATAPPGAF